MSLLDLPLEVIDRMLLTPEMYAAVRLAARAFTGVKFTAELHYYFYDTLLDWELPRAEWTDHIKRYLRIAPKFAWVYSVYMYADAARTCVFMIASSRDRGCLRAFLAATA